MFVIQFMSIFRIMCFDILEVNVEVLDVSDGVAAITTIIIWHHRCSSYVLELKREFTLCASPVSPLLAHIILIFDIAIRNL
jgi:hypothetical protein